MTQNLNDRNSFKGKNGLTRIRNAAKYSIAGYLTAWKDEEAFRQIILMNIVGVPLGFFLGCSFTEKVLLALPFIICIIVELLNSAIENVVDRISLDTHDLSKKAKDMGSAAQLTAQFFLCFTWATFFFGKL